MRWPSKGVTLENNAAVLFWKAFGPAEIAEEAREPFFKMLGIPPLPEEGDYFVALGEYAKQSKGIAEPPQECRGTTRSFRKYGTSRTGPRRARGPRRTAPRWPAGWRPTGNRWR